MKSFSKTSRAIIIAMVAVTFFIVTALAFTACDNSQQDKDQITKYDATFDASITMGQMGTFSFASVFKNAYVTRANGKYTLTAIFDKGEVEVMTMKGEIFVDDNPGDPDAVGGVANGTLGVYDANGDLVTDGVVATYSAGDDYGVNKAKEKHYYVKSVSFPVDSIRENYEITLYINSAMMGKQFSKESGYRATIKLDLNSGEVVKEISGLGVDTRGTFTEEEPEEPENPAGPSTPTGPSGSEEETPSTPAPQPVNPVADKYTQYSASLDAVVSMGGIDVNFTENLLDGVYVIVKDGKYEITLIFKADNVNMPNDNVTTGYITTEPYSVRGGGTATPEFGIYDGEEYVQDGITFTYSAGDEYVSTSSARYYYVKSMTFSVDEFEDEYVLSLCVMTAMGAGMQFPFNSSNGLVSAVLALDLTDADTVDSIDSLLGVENSGAIVEPIENEYTQYSASLDAVVSMGGNDVNFTENLLDGVYVIEKDGKYEITLTFKVGVVNMPYNNVTTGYITNEEYSVREGGTATPEFGFYDDDTLVKEGIVLTYAVNDDDDDSSFNYVKSMTFTVDEFAGSYNLSLCVMTAMGTGMQFPYNSSNGLVNAVLTLNLADAETVDSIDSLLGVESLD